MSDIAFSEGASKYLTHLQAKGMIESWRITRRKLGLAQRELGEFHLMIEVKDLAQLELLMTPTATINRRKQKKCLLNRPNM